MSVTYLFNCDALLNQGQGSFFRLAAGALILVLLPVFYLFIYLMKRYNFYIFQALQPIKIFQQYLKTVGQIAVIWMVELKIFVASPELDGRQSHHDCCLVMFLSFKLLSFGYLHGRMGCDNKKLPLINNGFVTCWLSINFDDPVFTSFFLHFT